MKRAPSLSAPILQPSASLEQAFAGRLGGIALPEMLVRALTPRSANTHPSTIIPYRLYGDPQRGEHLLEGQDPYGTLPVPLDTTFWQRVSHREVAGHVQSFGWLEDLLAVRSRSAVRLGQDIVAGWINFHSNGSGRVWHPALIARRIIGWVRAAPLLTFDADDSFRTHLTQSIAHHASLLARWCWLVGTDRARIEVETAHLLAGVYLSKPHPLTARAQNRTARHIRRWLRHSGGQHDSDPQEFLRVAFYLSLVIEACRQTDQKTVPELREVGQDLAGHLASLSLADQVLCRLGTGGMTPARLMSGTLSALGAVPPAQGTRQLAACASLASSGLHAALNTRGPRNSSGTLHPSALALELAAGGEALLMDTGSGAGLGDEIAAWSAAGHGCSTLHLSETPFPTDMIQLTPTPGMFGTLSRSWNETAHASQVTASCTGTQGSLQATIGRTLSLARDGARLDGRDTITLAEERPGRPVHIRLTFNLHPMVDILENGSPGPVIGLQLLSGDVWRFSLAGDTALAIADSLFVDDLRQEIWKTSRILVLDTLVTQQARYAWCFERVAE